MAMGSRSVGFRRYWQNTKYDLTDRGPYPQTFRPVGRRVDRGPPLGIKLMLRDSRAARGREGLNGYPKGHTM